MLRRARRTARAPCGRARETRGAALRRGRAPRARDVVDLDPAVAGDGGPRRPAQRQQRHAGARARPPRHWPRSRRHRDAWRRSAASMRSRAQIVGQARRRRRSRRSRTGTGCGSRRRGAAGERQRHVEVGAARRGARASMPRFRRAAENEDAWHGASLSRSMRGHCRIAALAVHRRHRRGRRRGLERGRARR